MKNKDVFYYITLFAVFCMIIYLTYSNVKLRNKMGIDNIELTSLKKNSDNRKKYQGNFIWQMIGMTEKNYSNFVSQNNLFGEYMFVIVNKIDCISCFKFHMTELNKIGITKIYYSPDNYELVQNHLNNCIELSQKHINTDKGYSLKKTLQ